MKPHKRLKETMDRRTYNLTSKLLFAGCSYCRWHSTFWKESHNGSFVALRYEEDGTGKPEKLKYRYHPNWKLVSKNQKQWMKKPFHQRKQEAPDGSYYIFFGW